MSYFGGQFEHHRMHATLCRNTVALAWGIPVEIVKILSRLDAFQTELPTLHNLRLCNSFGRGTHAHVTKLPREIIVMIEENLLREGLGKMPCRESASWSSRYCCFESSCHASDHAEGTEELEILDRAIAQVHLNHPRFQQSSSHQKSKNFRALVDREFHNLCNRSGVNLTTRKWFGIRGWKEALSDDKGGQLPRYRNLLSKYFGLELFVMHENLSLETGELLQRIDPRVPKERTPVQVTICYLTLPTKRATTHTMIDYGCGDSGFAAGSSGKSMLVEQESLILTSSHKKRFAICMRLLGLKPFVHASQLGHNLSAFSTEENAQVNTSATDHNDPYLRRQKKTSAQVNEEDEEYQSYLHGLEASQWPKLLLLSRERFDADGVPYPH